MLFGQLQIRRRSSTILSPDGLMDEFESVRRRKGSVRGFVLNPLSCVDISSVLSSLGYQTAPPKDFNFTKRNVHFAAACSADAKARLPIDVKRLLGEMLPDERGMVRICSDPPSELSQDEIPYESRLLDVPASSAAHSPSFAVILSDENCTTGDASFTSVDRTNAAPLVVGLDKEYSPGGPGVVSNRNMSYVGFNGLRFRKHLAFPELKSITDRLVRESWPIGMLHLQDGDNCEELIAGSETLKCAPENWVIREPVQRRNRRNNEIRARYPPRNMLNAKYERGPRQVEDWKPVATYSEPPVPIRPRTSACNAMCALKEEFPSINQNVNVLDVLRSVFKCLGGREHLVDPWLQKRVTQPRALAVEKYRKGLRLFQEREKGHPKAPRNAKYFFKGDAVIDAEARRIHAESAETAQRRTSIRLNKIKDKLYKEAERVPGGLEKYRCLAAKDVVRYAMELKIFKEVTQHQFDEAHGLLPVERNA